MVKALRLRCAATRESIDQGLVSISGGASLNRAVWFPNRRRGLSDFAAIGAYESAGGRGTARETGAPAKAGATHAKAR